MPATVRASRSGAQRLLFCSSLYPATAEPRKPTNTLLDQHNNRQGISEPKPYGDAPSGTYIRNKTISTSKLAAQTWVDYRGSTLPANERLNRVPNHCLGSPNGESRQQARARKYKTKHAHLYAAGAIIFAPNLLQKAR